MVQRRRLAEMLDAGVRGPVTLVCAGPGWGKSTLVAAWAEQRVTSGPIAWLALGPQHNDPRAFWPDVVMALRIAGALPAGNDPEHRDLDARSARARVLAALDALPTPVVLVLDDFHELDDARVIGGLTDLLHDPPPALRLVLVSRGEPALPLHRIRAAGDLTEIRARHLAFLAPEAAELPAVHRRHPPAAELAGLLERTEGWVAGLQLMADGPAEHGALGNGEVRAVSDYLLREVVARLPAKTRQFMIRTSVPDEVCGPLADALTGESHGRRILEHLESRNVFLTRVDDRPGWFRYHPLLRDALRHQIELDLPGAEAELHLLAAQWFAARQQISEALRHAADSGDWAYLGRLTVQRAMVQVLSGEQRSLAAILVRIPAEQHGATVELALCGAAVRYISGDRAGTAGLLRLARSLARRQTGLATSTDMTLRLMEAGVLHWRVGDMPGLVEKSTETLKLLTAYRLDELPSLLHYRAVALNEKGAGLLWTDNPDHADRYLWAAAIAARGVGSTLTEVNALSHLALLALMQGSVREASELVTSALDLARRHGFDGAAQVAIAYLAWALIEVGRDRAPEAQEALRVALHAGGEEPAAAPALLAVLVRAHMLLSAGEAAAARALLRQARADAPATLVAPVLDRWLRLAESEADLLLGGAREVVARYDPELPRGVLSPHELVCLARALLAVGEHDAAERLLARVRQGADHVAAVTAWIATAFAADAEGHGNRSIDAISRAVAIAEREGFRAVFRSFDQRRLAVLLDRRRWVEEHTASAAVMPPRPPGDDAPPPSDVLSERERDVLRYLPTVLTAGEIAGNLNISINTVKAHMRSIYRKLGAARRREAVVRARQLGLL